MRFTNFAIVTFSLFLSLGILTASAKLIPFKITIYGLISCWILFTAFWAIARNQLVQNSYFGIASYLMFFLIGVVHFQLNDPQHTKRHFSHFHTPETYFQIELKIVEQLKSDSYHNKYIIDVIGLGNTSVTGKALLQIRKDTAQFIDHFIDDRLLISAQISEIRPALNPNQFDYSKYMRTKGVFHQIRIWPRDILQYNSGKTSLRGIAERVRKQIIDKVHVRSKGKNEFDIFKALVLGNRMEIDRDLYEQYINAGAVHILAVSGLHVGLFYLILMLVLRPIERYPYGSFLLPLLIIFCLWVYAFITGLSESVIRSVTMFSLFAFAKFLHRRTNTINILFLSYFILILISPIRLFRIGFQLSYLAVFFILWVQPLIYSLYRPRSFIDRMLWGIISVSIAAQLGILPLSLYYFHRFPGLFLITNSVVLPFLGLLLGGGFLIIILTFIKTLPEFVFDVYWLMIELLNNFIEWVSANDSFIIENIHFSLEKTLFSYLFLFAVLLLWKVPKYRNIIFCLSSFLLLIGVFIYDNYKNSRNELVIFHKVGQTNIGFIQSWKFHLYRSYPDSGSSFERIIRPYMTSKNIQNFREIEIPELFYYNRDLVCIPDSNGAYPTGEKLDWVILTNNSKVNLERLIIQVDPSMIIADGSNWITMVERWKSTCIKYDIPFYSTADSGAFIFQ